MSNRKVYELDDYTFVKFYLEFVADMKRRKQSRPEVIKKLLAETKK